MRPLQTFRVIPALPAPLARLGDVAYNLRWAWDHDAIELFRRLDSVLWETTGHNPVRMLGTVDQARLDSASRDDSFLAHLARVAADFEQSGGGWFKRAFPNAGDLLVAYFSAEFGITECVSIFAGGLGVLAGDHLKSASDLGVPLVAVGLLYQQGYFRQYLNSARLAAGGLRGERLPQHAARTVPSATGAPVYVDVEYPGRRCAAQRLAGARGPHPALSAGHQHPREPPQDRDITDQLYGGDLEMRIQQEILLGIGGLRALEALDLHPTVCHMNEGHSAFLALERARRLMDARGLSFAEARDWPPPALPSPPTPRCRPGTTTSRRS